MKRTTLRSALPFILTIAALSFPISGVFDTATIFLDQLPWYVGAIIVVVIVLLGALFDMVGVASAAASETPFHAMASKRVYGAKRAIFIVRNAEKVSSICSDVVGDIAGVLSGAGALAVAVQLSDALTLTGWREEVVVILLTALVTSITVGAKAIGKTLAIQSPTPIILVTSKILETILVFRQDQKRSRRKKARAKQPTRSS
jgi:CBS domain containing-hemolysin-like protein